MRALSQRQFDKILFSVFPNGFNELEYKNVLRRVNDEEHYAITIGTYRYKQISIAFRLFKFLQEKDTKLQKFLIIGNRDDLPHEVRTNDQVVVDIGSNRESLIQWLSNAEYYISASQIESSSIATLEGLILSKSVVLSDIPSHREMLKNIEFEEIYVERINALFLMASFECDTRFPSVFSWNLTNQKLYETLENYKFKFQTKS